MSTINDLRRKAKELGIKVGRTAKATEIEAAIAAAAAPPAEPRVQQYAGDTVEHRDATISVNTRNQLSQLRGWLYKRSAIPAGHREDWLGAIDDVIARFDANDATAIWLTPDGEWAEEPAAA